MHIVYPYNEILPKKTAHDIYVMNKCLSLAQSGCEVELICGKGSLDQEELLSHYHANALHGLKIIRLPIVRNNNPIGLTWNRVFFFFCQQKIKKTPPDILITSVIKQADYHFSRKNKTTTYVYEVHGLTWYPNTPVGSCRKAFIRERAVLEKADLITVTTEALRQVLVSPPYSLKNHIEIVPLGVNTRTLPPSPSIKTSKEPLVLMYVGQLYKNQGIGPLLNALVQTKGIHLRVLGGKGSEIEEFKKQCEQLGISKRVVFYGFYPPSHLASLVQEADAFVTTFDAVGGMPYVAHTKLLEYAAWARPIVAPNLPVVREHLGPGKGALLFKPGCSHSLVQCLNQLKNKEKLDRLQNEITQLSPLFSWQKRAIHYKQILQNFSAG